MHRFVLFLLMILCLFSGISCSLDLSTTTSLTLSSTSTSITTQDALSSFLDASNEFMLDFTTYPTWYYESRFHLFENGHAEDEGIWYYDQFSIDFSVPYAYRHIDSNTDPSSYQGFEVYLNEIYESLNGCLAARRPIGLDVSFDSFRADSATRETMMVNLPAQPTSLLTLLTNEDIERIEDNHYRISMPMTPFLDFDEFIAFFDKYKYGIKVDYDNETFLFDVYFEENQVRIVALSQDIKYKKLYDYNTTIYIHRIDEVTRFTNTYPVDMFCPPDDPRLIVDPLTVPFDIKIYLNKSIYGFVRVDLEMGNYRVITDDIYGPSHFTNIQLFDESMTEIWGNNINVTTPGTYYIRLQSPYEANSTKLSVELVD